MCETQVWSLGQEDILEKEIATQSSTCAWKIYMGWGAWEAAVHGGRKESDTTERLHFYFRPWKSRNLLSSSSSSSPSGIQDFLWTYLNINSLTVYLSLVVEPQVKISRDLSWDPRVKQT